MHFLHAQQQQQPLHLFTSYHWHQYPSSSSSFFFATSLRSRCPSPRSFTTSGGGGNAFSGVDGVEKAHALLGLSDRFSARELRKAYFQASKRLQNH